MTRTLNLFRLVQRLALGFCFVAMTTTTSQASFITFEAAGANAAAITPTRDAFRTAVGGGSVAGLNGSFGRLHREINWDGIPDARADPNLLPANFFNSNSPRGVEFSTPGTGFLISANSGLSTPTLFGFSSDFQAFRNGSVITSRFREIGRLVDLRRRRFTSKPVGRVAHPGFARRHRDATPKAFHNERVGRERPRFLRKLRPRVATRPWALMFDTFGVKSGSRSPKQNGNLFPTYSLAPSDSTAVNSNIKDVSFFVPGTSTVATTNAFGVVFVDVEVATLRKIECFDQNSALIHTRDALVAGNQGLSFVGAVAKAGEAISRVRLTSGLNTIVSNGVLGNPSDDVVVMDDILYAEPTAVPEPSSFVLATLGMVGGIAWFRRRQDAL